MKDKCWFSVLINHRLHSTDQRYQKYLILGARLILRKISLRIEKRLILKQSLKNSIY